MRAATDKDIQENLRKAVDELRNAADRVQGKEDHSTRNTMLLLTGIALGILFNPMTGPADASVADGQDHGRELGRLLVHAAAGADDAARARRRARPPRRRAVIEGDLATPSRRRSEAPSPSAETGATSARSSEPGLETAGARDVGRPQQDGGRLRRVALSGTGGAQPRPAAKRDVVEPPPRAQIRERRSRRRRSPSAAGRPDGSRSGGGTASTARRRCCRRSRARPRRAPRSR